MKIQKKNTQSQAQAQAKLKKEKANNPSLQDFVKKRLWGRPVSIQDGFRAFYARNADKYQGDFEQALLDFTRQR